MQHAPAQGEHSHPQNNLEMSLREQLLAAGASASVSSPYPQPPLAGAPGPEHPYSAIDSPSPNDNLDPNVAHQQHAPYAHMSGDSAGDDGSSPQGGKGKRELSTSKRAAQNRAAQRAFRQRKEGYIKKLEEQVKEFQNMEQNYRTLQSENFQLREYILNLQSRLLESSSDIPPAPAHIELPSSSGAPRTSRDPHPTGSPFQGQSQSQSLPRHGDRQDPLMHLQAAAAQAEGRPPHQSMYGLGGGADYSNKRLRTDGPGTSGVDSKGGL
ncbi:hypothetical protein LTR02_014156 [Friedmanniomyces endolithicus]|uniref:Putative transcription factor kapC n=1 Tax=Rachicladosporium monterosium TaxID=1507873 RepID=A0ABR0L3L3_9PEZI|nr:hypothetical protein LTR03_017562 [Friedmanniomyces endolithicus]KAK5142956.1 hypothetical protein LTR32_004805 [Rachicladosporium monterosium]KAK0844459.1 hypothetical protein LTS02_015673 [Friedmanniomyces endolithicus]KAK0878788.1 hypothetical protein LTR87_007384 [Friedmanniomyces endolithicus]KAK0891239.1 hypothetical protein LTR02_014156 [Friedmanniomyces endolithicus]